MLKIGYISLTFNYIQDNIDQIITLKEILTSNKQISDQVGKKKIVKSIFIIGKL